MISNISRITTFQECRTKAKYWSIDGLAPLRDADPLMLGGAVHEGLAEFLAARDPRKAVELVESSYRQRLESQIILPEERPAIEQSIEMGKRLVARFCAQYSSADMQVIWPEVEFTVPMPSSLHHCWFFHQILHPDIPFDKCPAVYKGLPAARENQCMQPIYFQGKTDAVVSWKNAIWLLEHKTTSYTGDIFYDKFFLDFQPTGYLYGIGKAMGTTPHGFILNVLKKPTKNKKDQLDVGFESDYFLRSDEDLKRFEEQFILQAQDFEDAVIRDRMYMNTKSCTAWNRRCYYWNICKRHGQPSPDEFRQKDMDYVDLKYYEILGMVPPVHTKAAVVVDEV